ncbi:MAG: BamA/TamA family outer membrane protein [Bryobacteraceae bacterium]|nr:BamA/TamA family outer membrane protein [Bryobacteraceae bacterium]
MRVLAFALSVLLSGALLWGQQALNVNSRYTIEAVDVVPSSERRFSPSLRRDLQKIIGEKLDPEVLNELSWRIRRELDARMVSQKIVRGSEPEHVKVVFEVIRRKGFAVTVPKLAYHSRQGWSAGIEGTARFAGHAVTVGVISDADELLERFAGVRFRYERERLGSAPVGLSVEVEDLHQQWNPAVSEALGQPPQPTPDTGGIYRWRRGVHPALTLRLGRTVTVVSGIDLQRFETQYPAARTESAHAVSGSLRYQNSWEGTNTGQRLEAAYAVRAGTSALGSDYSYARHSWSGLYQYRRDRSSVRLAGLAGTVGGRAPLFERFVLGNAGTLRGWNKYDLQPLGGARVAYGSVEYRYRNVHAFYDTGALWNRNEEPDVKHSLGAGLHAGNLYFTVGFPVREGRMAPIFILAMNF